MRVAVGPAPAMPTSSSSSPARGRRAPPVATPCSSIGSTICSPTLCTGLNAFIAPWNTIAMSRQRCGRIVSSPPREDVLPVEQHLARRRAAVGGSSPISDRIAVVLPQPDSPTRPIRSPSSQLERRRPGRRAVAAPEVEPDVEVLDPRAAAGRAALTRSPSSAPSGRSAEPANGEVTDAQRGFSASSMDPDHRAREDDQGHADAGRDDRPPGVVDRASPSNAFWIAFPTRSCSGRRGRGT